MAATIVLVGAHPLDGRHVATVTAADATSVTTAACIIESVFVGDGATLVIVGVTGTKTLTFTGTDAAVSHSGLGMYCPGGFTAEDSAGASMCIVTYRMV